MAQQVIREEPGTQEIHTRDHGTVKVKELSFIDGGFHIVRTPNGAYQHHNGLPVANEDQLRKAMAGSPDELARALEWYNNRHASMENAPRPIGFNQDGVPCFEDGTVVDFPDLYAFFKPGPILTAAIVALQLFKDGKPQAAAAPAPPAPQKEPEAPKVEAKAPAKPKTAKARGHHKKPAGRAAKPPEPGLEAAGAM